MRRSSVSARRAGQNAGFRQGRNDGYRIGYSESAISHIPLITGPIRNLHILYVTAGISEPYPAIDRAIIEGLRQTVSGLTVAAPDDDVLALAVQHAADLVLVLNGTGLQAEKVAALRQHGFKTAIWFTDDPYYTDWTIHIAPRYDYVFTLEVSCVPFYQNLGCKNVYYMPFAMDPNIFYPKRIPEAYATDICFIGTAFWNRVALFDQIAPFLQNRKVVISGWWWDRLKNYKMLAGKIKQGDWMASEETANYYNGAKIVINYHRSVDDPTINCNQVRLDAQSANPRTFEIAGCATLQLVDARSDLASVYTPGSEIATFSSPDELMSKINYYLTHDEERQQIALNGMLRTRRHHTYYKRLSTMLSIIFP